MIKSTSVEHREHLSDRSFQEILATFMEVTGSVEEGYAKVAADATDVESFERIFAARESTSGFMRFAVIDHGKWLTDIYNIPSKAVMVVLGNPLIAITMLRHDRGVGLNVPVRISIYEDVDGRTRVSYDLPSTLMESLENDEVTAAARKLDAKLIALATQISGVDA
jgi:uncharacterized protein (DUF302 family)